jgi:peroxiredoxin
MTSIITGAAAAAHSTAASLLAASPIKVGDKLPAVKVKEDDPESKVEIHNVNGKVLIVSLLSEYRRDTPSTPYMRPI